MSLRPFTILVTSVGGQAVILPTLVLVTLTLLAGPLVVVILFHGFELGAEGVIERVALQLNLRLGVCR